MYLLGYGRNAPSRDVSVFLGACLSSSQEASLRRSRHLGGGTQLTYPIHPDLWTPVPLSLSAIGFADAGALVGDGQYYCRWDERPCSQTRPGDSPEINCRAF